MTAGSVWEGRGIRVRVLSVGLAVVWVERLDLSRDLKRNLREHPWDTESFKGMRKVR